MLTDTLQTTVLNNRILDYIIFIAAFLASIVGVRLIKSIILNRLKAWSEKTLTTIDDFLVGIFEKKLIPILYFGGFYLSFHSLTLADSISRTVDIAGIVFLTIFGLRLIMALINYTLEAYWIKKEVNTSRQKSLKGVITIVKVVVWGIGITFLLDNMGFKISAVVAGLGIGGIAVALAAQTVLGDLFSYFIIFIDRPFEIGDFIIIDSYMGNIEYIGIKTTRVRSLGGEQLIFSNSDLTNSRIRNYKKMEKRRVLFSLGVTYQTTSEQLKEIPVIIKKCIDNVAGAKLDRAHFASYGDFSLNFEVVYYVMSADYGKYMDIQQEINLVIKDEFEKRSIEFAYPTQSLFIEKQPGSNA